MTELERRLHALALHVELPAQPDLRAAVGARIAMRSAPRLRQALALGLVVVALAIGIAFAVPPARSGILRFFGFGGVRIELVDRLPVAPLRNELDLGPLITLKEARAAVDYRVLTSDLVGSPTEVHRRGDQVGFVYRAGNGVKLLVTQFPGSESPGLVKKLYTPQTRIVFAPVGGSPGYWITGAPHIFLYLDSRGRVTEQTLYLAGNTLLWQRGSLTLRLEGRLSLGQALRIARSFR
jgi:hypothetical protein